MSATTPGHGKGGGQDNDQGGGQGNDTLTRDLISYARAAGQGSAADAATMAEAAIAAVGRSSYLALIQWIDQQFGVS
jgi:hypothetical protein